jgi:hypothetical protein
MIHPIQNKMMELEQSHSLVLASQILFALSERQQVSLVRSLGPLEEPLEHLYGMVKIKYN